MEKLGNIINQQQAESTTSSTTLRDKLPHEERLSNERELNNAVDQAAKDVLNRMVAADKSHQERQNKGRLSEVWVLAIFKKFQARYLHKWTSAIDGIEAEAMSEWSRVLAGLTGDQIKHGLDTWDGEWYPTAGEFRQACLGHQKNGFGLDYVPQMYREEKPTDAKQLETDRTGHMTASKETVEGEIAKMRAKL